MFIRFTGYKYKISFLSEIKSNLPLIYSEFLDQIWRNVSQTHDICSCESEPSATTFLDLPELAANWTKIRIQCETKRILRLPPKDQLFLFQSKFVSSGQLDEQMFHGGWGALGHSVVDQDVGVLGSVLTAGVDCSNSIKEQTISIWSFLIR